MAKTKRRKRGRNPEDFPTGQFIDVEKMKVNVDADGNVKSIDVIVADGDMPSSLIHPVGASENRRRNARKKRPRATNKRKAAKRKK